MTETLRVRGGTLTFGDLEGAEAHLAKRAAELGRKCGSCSLCCKVLEIPEIEKPAGRWCKDCKPGHGCAIYEKRPEVCRAFGCQWLVDGSFSAEWAPTRSKMVLRMMPGYDGGLALHVVVDPSYPNAWRKSPYYEHLKDRSTRIGVMVCIGTRRISLFPPDKEVEFGEYESVVRAPDWEHCGPSERQSPEAARDVQCNPTE